MPSAQPGVIVLGSDFKALAAIRALGRRRIPVAIVDRVPRAAWRSRFVSHRLRWEGRMDEAALADAVLALGERRHLDGWVLMPMQDDAVEMVAKHHSDLSRRFRLLTPDWTVVRELYDKRRLNRLADEASVARPATWCSRDADAALAAGLRFPAIIKPAASIELQHVLGAKAVTVLDPVQLRAQYDVLAAAVGADGLLVQELIPGGGESQFSVAAFCMRGRILTAMTARRWRQYPIDFGLSSTFVEAAEVPDLVPLAARLLARTEVSGPVEVEFKRDPRDGAFKVLDVNVRLWAWHGLCRVCGIDFASLHYDAALDRVPERPPLPTYGARWMRLTTDLPAALAYLRAGSLGLHGWLGSYRGRLVPSVLDLSDPLPMVADMAWTVRRAVGLRSRRARRAHATIDRSIASAPLETPRLSG